MENLSDLQLRATLVMQEAEEYMTTKIEELSSEYTPTPYLEERLKASLKALVETSIKYGQLKSTHEKLLKDVTQK